MNQAVFPIQHTGESPSHYPIDIAPNAAFDAHWPSLLQGGPSLVVAPSTLSTQAKALAQHMGNVPHILIPDGEAHKSQQSVDKIHHWLITHHYPRNSTLVALGGGVITDLTGFAAACYLRGIRCINCPTSLLAQVDAAVGSKTAINHPLGKNLIGAFHAPSHVLIDPGMLSTLPQRHYQSGFAEVIKYALIYDQSLWADLQTYTQAYLERQIEPMAHLIGKCVASKLAFVCDDPTEQHRRAMLNFGHTVGHAIESASQYDIHHGEAIAMGTGVALNLSTLLGYFPAEQIAPITQLYARYGLSTKLPTKLGFSELKPYLYRDKKANSEQLTFICLKAMAKAVIHQGVSIQLVQQAIEQERTEA